VSEHVAFPDRPVAAEDAGEVRFLPAFHKPMIL